MGLKICFQIGCRIPQWHLMFLQKGVHLESRLIAHQPANLALVQRSRAIRLDGNRLERAPLHVIPLLRQSSRNVVGQVDRDRHDVRAFYAFTTVTAWPAQRRCEWNEKRGETKSAEAATWSRNVAPAARRRRYVFLRSARR